MSQLIISFESTHRWENNPKSQAILNERRDDFNSDNWEVLKRLLKTERITVKQAMMENLSGHLPRRIADLREYGIDIQMDMVEPSPGARKIGEYYMKQEEINRVMLALVEGLRFERRKAA